MKTTPLLLCLFVSSLAMAQNVAPPGGGGSTVAPGQNATRGTTRLQFPNSDVKEVLSFYERLTGKRIVTDNQVTGAVNIVVAGDVPTAEAIRIIETNLLLNGFTLVPVDRTNIIKVVGAKSPRSAAIPVISDELLLPEGEQVVTFVAKLRFADPQELQQILTAYVGPGQGGFTNISALPSGQALLMTESSATIRSLLRIVREIDNPPAEVVSEFIALERADAADVLDKLKGIFEKPQSGNSGRTATPKGTALPAGATAEVTSGGTLEIKSTLSEDTIIAGKIKLTADIRTNRIHVVTRPANMQFVKKLVREFDAVGQFGEPVSRPLRYVSVGDVLDVVVKAISEPGTKEVESTSTLTANQAMPASVGSTGSGNLFGNNSDYGSGGGSGSGSGFNVSEGLSTQPVNTIPEARVVGTTKIIADKNANAIIVLGGADVRSKIFRLLDQLDQRIPQVMLHTTVGELNLNEKEQFGVDYILRSAGLGTGPIILNGSNGTNGTPSGNDGTGTGASTAGSGTNGTTGNTTNNGSTINSGRRASDIVSFGGSNQPLLNLNNLLNQDTVRAVAAGGASGLSGFVTAGNSLTAIVTALENTNRFRVVSRPSVFTRNNKKAIIASGQEIAVPRNIQSALNTTNNSNGITSNSTVEYKRVAQQLEVVPLINSDREVALDVLQKVDEISGSTRIDNNDIPSIATRYVKTSVTVADGGTLVLGGLIKQSFNRNRSGIPVLGKIPVLGYLFSNNNKEKIRTELVILIRPVVSWAPPESNLIRQRAEEFLNMDSNLESTLYPPRADLSGNPVPFRNSAAARANAPTSAGPTLRR